jgi:sulfite exporter TauE/SafE
MCGPIAFMLPVNRQNSVTKVFQTGAYHFGRLAAYVLMGVFFGWIGKGLYIFGMQQNLSIAIGVIMIIVALTPTRTLNRLYISRPLYRVIGKIKSSLGKALKRKTTDTFLTIGFLNGFLPCGLVYMALFAAIATGNSLQGAAYMALFGLGTIPMMTMAIYLGKFLNTAIRQRIQNAIPVMVVLIGLLFVLRGLGLGIPFISPAPVVEMASSAIECH